MGVYIHKRCDVMANPKRSAIPESVKKKKESSITRNPARPGTINNKISLRILNRVRANVGARNPRVIAIRKILIMNPEEDIHSFLDLNLKYLMMKAFKITSEAAYQAMFDPKSGSPIYYGLYDATRKLAKSKPQFYRESLPFLKSVHSGKTGAIPDFCQNLHISGGLSTTPIGRNPIYTNTSKPVNGGFEFNDPVQGCLADCWLIAAISSVAWAASNNAQFTNYLAKPLKVLPINNSSRRPISTFTSQAFWLDQTGNPYYARLNANKIINKDVNYEIWPCHYEKAYALFYNLNSTYPFTTNDTPTYSVLSFGSAYKALTEITGIPFTWINTVDYLGTTADQDNITGMINLIRTNACDGTDLVNKTLLPTIRPTVADTYLTAESPKYVPLVANNKANYVPLTVAYNCAGISANHTYSILGLYKDGEDTYVVLRNPWGFAGDSASFNSDLQKNLATSLTSLPSPGNVTNTGAEGIFGLKVLTFMRYFQKLGWV